MNERNKKRILLADNAVEYRRAIRGLLELEGYEIGEAGTPKEAQKRLEENEFDLVLADLRMQDDNDANDISGLEIAKFASERGIPCILVTAHPTVELAQIALRARGSEPFATDLLSKSSGPQALQDAINQTLRHLDADLFQSKKSGFFIDSEKRLVWKDGKLIDLSLLQYRLLEELSKKHGGVSTYAELIRAIYGEIVQENDAVNDRRLKNLVERTKEKIEDTGTTQQYLEAVPGWGYRLNPRFAGDSTTDAPPPKKKKGR